MCSLVNFLVTYYLVNEAKKRFYLRLDSVTMKINTIYVGKIGFILNYIGKQCLCNRCLYCILDLCIVVLCRVEHLVNKVTELQETLQNVFTNSNGESQ